MLVAFRNPVTPEPRTSNRFDLFYKNRPSLEKKIRLIYYQYLIHYMPLVITNKKNSLQEKNPRSPRITLQIFYGFSPEIFKGCIIA